MPRFTHTHASRWLTVVLLISAVAVVVAGCGGGSGKSSANATAATPPPAKIVGAPGATVRFVTPRAGSTVTGSTVRVRVRISGFTLDPGNVGRAARQGFGHLHFSLDAGRYDTPHYAGANGTLAARLGAQGRYSPSVTPTITYRHVRLGRHTLIVYLANNDHSNTGVQARVTFTVRKAPPVPPPAAISTPVAPSTQSAPAPAPAPQSSAPPAPAPQASGDGDADNNGGPDDGDGNQ